MCTSKRKLNGQNENKKKMCYDPFKTMKHMLKDENGLDVQRLMEM